VLYLVAQLIMHYQVLVDDTDIYLKTLDAHPSASSFFDKAKDQYVEEYEGGSDIRDRLNTIVFAQINDVRTKFSEAELARQDG
jgi:hypothetical protein